MHGWLARSGLTDLILCSGTPIGETAGLADAALKAVGAERTQHDG